MSEPMIRIENLFKSFGPKKVLQGLNLDIERGESMVIIGGSGTGKSVLIKHIIGLLNPDAGKVFVSGQCVGEMNEGELNELRKRFGMLFQGAALFDSMTVWENVGFGLLAHTNKTKREVREIVGRKLQQVGMKGIEDLMPSELSGGMKKRVGLARAIAMNPEIILYDEPTTGLDPIMADVINNLIIKLQQELDVTSISITHDMVSAYKVATRIAMLYQGEIIYVGTPEEIQNCNNPVVQQFIQGKMEGPITMD
jgi:phospholipid/cholesterol/gamma-HCH transport system ATP-binding protein